MNISSLSCRSSDDRLREIMQSGAVNGIDFAEAVFTETDGARSFDVTLHLLKELDRQPTIRNIIVFDQRRNMEVDVAFPVAVEGGGEAPMRKWRASLAVALVCLLAAGMRWRSSPSGFPFPLGKSFQSMRGSCGFSEVVGLGLVDAFGLEGAAVAVQREEHG